MHHPRTAWRIAGFSLLLVASLSGACFRVERKSPLMKSSENLQEMTSSQLRLKVYAFVDRFASTVDATANRIADQSDDPVVRRNALVWKMTAISECDKAAFQPDPLAGLIDVAVLSGQMVQFLDEGAGRDLFGALQPIAVEATKGLDRELWELGSSLTISGDPAKARQDIEQWVAEHPIDDVYYRRDSTRSLLQTLSASRRGGIGALAGGLDDTVNDLAMRMTIYADQLPYQARWQAELMALDMLGDVDVEKLAGTTETLTDSLERVTSTVEGMPDLVERERGEVLAAVDDMTRSILADVDAQRRATIDELRKERLAVLEAADVQRRATIEALRTERLESMEQIDAMATRAVADTFDRAEALVDHLFWRVVLLLGAFALALVVAAALIARSLRASAA